MDLTDEEKQAAAMACRVAMRQAETDRDAQSSPTVRDRFETSVRMYRTLAGKFEKARSGFRPG